MKTLFYDICEVITENITGIVNGEMNLWELGEYLRVLNRVELIVNLIVLTGLLCVTYVLIDCVKDCYNTFKKKPVQTERD